MKYSILAIALFSMFSLLLAAPAQAQTPKAMVKCAADTDAPRSSPRGTKAVNGAPTGLSDWPWFAALRLRNENKKEVLAICGGSLIAPNWVLTAAHCVHNIDRKSFQRSAALATKSTTLDGARLDVVTGVDDLRAIDSTRNVHAVREIVIHEDYERSYQAYVRSFRMATSDEERSLLREPSVTTGRDIALIRISPSWFGELAPLATTATDDADIPSGAHARLAGFGSVEVILGGDGVLQDRLRTYPMSNGEKLRAGCARLMQVSMPLVSTEHCVNEYTEADPVKQTVFKPVIGPQQICAGYLAKNQDACSGDSGGPLVIATDRGPPLHVAGVVSWGKQNCAGEQRSYGVYTRVAHFHDWIQSKIGRQAKAGSAATRGTEPFARSALADIDIHLAEVKGRIKLEIPGGATIRLGQEYKFNIESTLAGRLIIIDIDADNKITQIFPNRFIKSENSTRIAANAITTVPSGDMPFTAFRATEPLGQSKLIALVVPDDFPTLTFGVELEEQRKKGFEPVRRPTDYVMNLVQQIEEHVIGLRAQSIPLHTRWAYGQLEYAIVPR